MLRRNCLQISHLWYCSSAAAGIRSISSSFDIPAVSKLVAERKIFDSQLVASGTTEFCNLKFDATYNTLFPVEAIADHAYGYLTAIARSKYGSNFFYSKEKETSAFYFTTSSTEGQLRAMRRIDGLITRAGLQATHGASVRCYSAANSDVVFYSVEITPYVSATPKPEELSTSVLGTKKFIESKSEDVKAQYQALMDRVFTSTKPAFDMTTDSDGETVIISLATLADRTTHLAPLSALILEAPGATIVKKFCETFSNGVHVYRFYVRGCSAKLLEKRVALNALLPNRPNNMITALHEQQTLTAEETIFAHCLITFAYYFTPPPTDDDYTALRSHLGDDAIGVKRLNNLRNTLSQEMTSERYMGELFSHYPTFAKKLYADFLEGSTETSRAALRAEIHNALKRDGKSNFDADLFDTFLKFNASVLKHNFACANKAALAFRLDPVVFMKGLDFPRVPHGIFFFVGGQWRGFHVRFTEIARGGVRMIISTPSSYRKNKLTVFQENYNLAFTQLLKNKDIPEGGSKGTLLVSSRYINKFDEVKCKQLFLQYVDALLDVIIPGTEGVVDNYKKEEIIFLGPDENTAGTFPKAGALYSRDRGYSAWKSFTTGKDPDVGGIPHDTYGMTTRSVRQCVEGIYRKLGMDEKAQTKFQTGGPDGDLGSNEILRSNEKYLALVDISASVYDPAGVNKDELVRLARARLRLEHFNPKCLSPKGFLVKQTDKNVKLPDGTVVADGAAFRDTFHLSPYTRADVFVPCGGRPASVTLQNVHELINVDGATGEAMLSGKYEKVPRDALKYKVIVEGANLFLTQDARLALERCGVVIIKDSTANKGGVTSSSLEVLAGLSLSDEEHQQLMRAKDQHDAPQFYKDLVAEICARVEKNAAREFEAIWKEHLLDPKRPKTLICDALSEKIVNVRTNILRSNLFSDQKFLRYVMESYTPKTLQAVVPIDTLMQRVPANYQHAICAMWLASDYVYKTGDRGTEFDFFQFMQAHFNEATK